VFTARYALSPYIKHTRFAFEGLNVFGIALHLLDGTSESQRNVEYFLLEIHRSVSVVFQFV
jgi:hypothetical protein